MMNIRAESASGFHGHGKGGKGEMEIGRPEKPQITQMNADFGGWILPVAPPGLGRLFSRVPGAYAPGYNLTPLRGSCAWDKPRAVKVPFSTLLDTQTFTSAIRFGQTMLKVAPLGERVRKVKPRQSH